MEQIKIIRSRRKTISLTITKEQDILVKAPFQMTDFEIEAFVRKHENWINKHMERIQQNNANRIVLTPEQISELKTRAKLIVDPKVIYYSEIIGVAPQNIKITSATTRWGSCSGKNNLCFPYKIALIDEELINYIVVHELCHIRVKNHSKKFHSELAKYMSDYREIEKKLRAITINY